jgi:RNA polymerase sigma-70 factor (ECF subfamily)
MRVMTDAPETSQQKPAAAAGQAELVELLARVAKRDSQAFAKLYKLTQAKLHGVVARIVSRGDTSGELLQEAFVKIWEKAADYDPEKGSPIAWMATIARHRALDELRRVRPVSLEDMPEGFEPAAEEVDPMGARDRSEQLTALTDCLKKLDEEKREAVMLAYYRGYSREALARRYDKPVPTVKTWLRRSLLQLKECLGS